jgi:hypothetical protein
MGLFVDLLVKAEKEHWCGTYFCTTCGNRDFRTRLAEIEMKSLAEDLQKTHTHELLAHPSWSDALRITAHDFRFMNWDGILQSWLPEAGENINFLDHVLFYLINYVPCKSETRELWVSVCIAKALSSKNPSLLESLIRVLGSSAANHPEVIEAALEISATNYRLHNALVKTGFLRSEDEISRENRARKMQLRATRNLHAAIRRKDVKAIAYMLQWRPYLDAKDREGVSIADFAKASNDNRIIEIFKTYYATQ